jgi:hypothetical protein
MPDPTIQVEIAKIEGRVTVLERDTSRALENHAKGIERQGARNDAAEADIRLVQMELALLKADSANQAKLKWIIAVAIVTQIVATVAPWIRPPATTLVTPPETTRRR